MTYVKINDILYPAVINGKMVDRDWDDRESKTIILEMKHDDAVKLFNDELPWTIVDEWEQAAEDGTMEIVREEYDNSDFSVAGSITDNRDGTLSVKMGKPTAGELLEILTGEVL